VALHRKLRKSGGKEGVPGIDFGKDLGLGGIVVASQLAVLHAESVAPKGEMSNCGFLGLATPGIICT
jgi:hypothetical protein